MKKCIFLFLLCVFLCGCTQQPNETQPANPQPQQAHPQENETTQPVAAQIDVAQQFTQRDRSGAYDESQSAVITLNGTTAQCSSNAVKIDGSTVTVTDEGCYILRGALNNGQITVNADKQDKVQLVLDGVQITSQTSAPILILQTDKTFITLAPGTENTLSNGGGFAESENNVDAVIFSKEDVTLNGTGTLTVTSPAGHGIVSKDTLTVAGGTYQITCASHAMVGKDSLCLADANVTATSGKDGLHAENADANDLGYIYIESGTFLLTAEGDGISAQSTLQLDGGSYTVKTGGGSQNASKQTSDNWGGFGDGMGGGFGGGMGGGKRPGGRTPTDTATTTEDSTSIKGLKAGALLLINGGSFTLDTADDSLHSNGDLTVTAGDFTVSAGDDGFHADETLTLQGGTVQISESYEGLEGLHIRLTGADVTLTASDDGLNAAGGTDQSGFGGRPGDQFGGRMGMGGMSSGNGSIVISDGNLQITASGDGIDANGTLEITGGYTVVCGPTHGDTATLDYDKTATISGGTFIGTGAMGMAQTFSESSQGVLSVRSGNLSAGTQIILRDHNGNTLLQHTPALDYAVVILSTPELRKGESYLLTLGSAENTCTAN